MLRIAYNSAVYTWFRRWCSVYILTLYLNIRSSTPILNVHGLHLSSFGGVKHGQHGSRKLPLIRTGDYYVGLVDSHCRQVRVPLKFCLAEAALLSTEKGTGNMVFDTSRRGEVYGIKSNVSWCFFQQENAALFFLDSFTELSHLNEGFFDILTSLRYHQSALPAVNQSDDVRSSYQGKQSLRIGEFKYPDSRTLS